MFKKFISELILERIISTEENKPLVNSSILYVIKGKRMEMCMGIR